MLAVVLFVGCATASREVSYEYYNIGNTYFEVGDFNKAVEYYEKALEDKELNDNQILYNLGVAYSRSGRFDKGVAHLQLLLDKDPENLRLLQSIAFSYFLAGEKDGSEENYLGAVEYYDEILSISEYDSIALFNKSRILLKLDAIHKTENQEEVDSGDSGEVPEEVIVIDENATDEVSEEVVVVGENTADEVSEEVVVVGENATGEEGLAQIDSENVSLFDEAKKLLEKLYEFDATAQVLIALGDLYKEEEDWESFLRIFQLALAGDKNEVEEEKILRSLIDFYENENDDKDKNDYIKIIEYLDYLLDLDSLENDKDLLFKKGSLLILQLTEYDEGYKFLRKSVDSGFDDVGEIKTFLETENLIRSEELKRFFQSNNLFD